MKVKTFITVTAAALIAMITGGCTPMPEVTRTVRLQELPSKEAVEAALRDVHEIGSVSYYEVKPDEAWTLFGGVIRDPPYDSFLYSADRSSGVLEFPTHRGEKKLILHSWVRSRPPSQQDVAECRAVMDKIYASLRRHAPEIPPESEVKEEAFVVPELTRTGFVAWMAHVIQFGVVACLWTVIMFTGQAEQKSPDLAVFMKWFERTKWAVKWFIPIFLTTMFVGGMIVLPYRAIPDRALVMIILDHLYLFVTVVLAWVMDVPFSNRAARWSSVSPLDWARQRDLWAGFHIVRMFVMWIGFAGAFFSLMVH